MRNRTGHFFSVYDAHGGIRRHGGGRQRTRETHSVEIPEFRSEPWSAVVAGFEKFILPDVRIQIFVVQLTLPAYYQERWHIPRYD